MVPAFEGQIFYLVRKFYFKNFCLSFTLLVWCYSVIVFLVEPAGLRQLEILALCVPKQSLNVGSRLEELQNVWDLY